MKKIYYTWSDVESQTQEIIRQITISDWRPDYVVGLTRGGLTPANLLSQYLEVPMECLKVSLRDGGQTESNSWMAKDAFGGYTDTDNPKKYIHKNILVVDDINDSGATLNWIMKDWPQGCHPDNVLWSNIWNNNVRFAVLVNNEASEFKRIDYMAVDIDKSKEPSWIVFPWEDWWKK
jgi:hypoxanthine phosphoribosyltransferase